MSEGPELRFQSLEFNSAPWSRWVWSFAAHAGAVLVIVAIPVTVHNVVQPQRRTAAVSLAIAPHPVPVKPLKRQDKPVPRVEFKAPPVKPVQTKMITLPPAPVDIPKPPEIVRVEAPKIDLPARPLIKQEVFAASNAAPVSPAAPLKSIKTGEFGEPGGESSPNKRLAVRTVGAFDAAIGQGTGKASGGARKAVVSSGFGEYEAPVRETQASHVAAPVETPVEITYKPKPLYTPEAREKKVEGEVQLEVLFSSTGQIRVLRVLRGLGFGLDESARAAASQIRFHPCTRNGSPVDVTGTVHIIFELS